jgi:hypothetical protein
MGGMSLTSFSKTAVPTEQTAAEPKAPTQASPSAAQITPKRRPKAKKSEVLVTVNIKITESQQEWLAERAKQVRRNNDEPVPASDRVYPQHLIGVAIDLLSSTDVNWSEIKSTQDLKQVLGL